MKLQPLAVALLSLTASLSSVFAQDDILTRKGDYTPTINFTDTYGERILRSRDGSEIIASERISARIVANLAEFDATELSADSPVSVSIGDFAFEGTIADFLPVDRDGNVAEFNPARRSGTYFYQVEKLDRFGEAATDRFGNILYVKVGSISLSWTDKRLTIDVRIADAARAEVGSMVEGAGLIGLADDGIRGGTINFSGEGVPVSVAFGSASGESYSYAKGNTKTVYRKMDGDFVPLNSATAIGAADATPPAVTVAIPSNDGGAGGIDFAGTITDIAPSTLEGSESLGFVDVVAYVNDPDFVAPIPADEVTDADKAGKHEFSFFGLPLDPGANTVVLVVTDESGNQTVITKQVESTNNPFN